MQIPFMRYKRSFNRSRFKNDDLAAIRYGNDDFTENYPFFNYGMNLSFEI